MTAHLPRSQAAVRRIVALSALILTIAVAGGGGLMAYTAIAGDHAQVSQERELVSHRVETSLKALSRWVNAAAIWDSAYQGIGGQVSLSWIDANMGSTIPVNLGHGVAMVLDGQDRLVYVRRDPALPPQASTEAFRTAMAPLLTRLRAQEAPDLLVGAAAKVGKAAAVTRSGVVLVGHTPYLVSLATIVPEHYPRPAGHGAANLLVAFQPLDHRLLPGIMEDFGVRDVRLEPADAPPEAAQVPLVGMHGAVVGHVAWTPRRPGADAVRRAAPAFAVALLVFLAAVAAFGLRFRAILRDLVAGDRALEATLHELVEARDRADAANVAKSQFLANMSHEIRTPLNGVLGMAQIMARDDLSDVQRQRLNVVQDSGRTLLAVLNDVLDFSKIEAGRLEVDNHAFDLADTLEGACAAFADIAAQKGVALRLDLAADAAGVWWGDGVRLRQVISNLVSNAVKFTSDGEIVVGVQVDAAGVVFAVRDCGIGIPAERLDELFQKFTQVDASTNRRFGGTGLGLAISRELVELMGGTMAVASEVGKGSTFTFDLPLERVGEAAAPATRAAKATLDREGGGALRILAAEDNATNQLILKALLEPLGVDLTVAGDGEEAVAAFRPGRFDVVLMDVQMPVMNGVEATTQIRALEEAAGAPAVPILALSANVMSHQVAEYLAAGMNGFVAKPIEADKLIDAIQTALAEDAAPDAARTSAA